MEKPVFINLSKDKCGLFKLPLSYPQVYFLSELRGHRVTNYTWTHPKHLPVVCSLSLFLSLVRVHVYFL